jgi:hypothetical protein
MEGLYTAYEQTLLSGIIADEVPSGRNTIISVYNRSNFYMKTASVSFFADDSVADYLLDSRTNWSVPVNGFWDIDTKNALNYFLAEGTAYDASFQGSALVYGDPDISAWVKGNLFSGVHADPDPFSPNGDGWHDRTSIHYTTSAVAPIKVTVLAPHPCYDNRILLDSEQDAGAHSVSWDGCLHRNANPCPTQGTLFPHCPLGFEVPAWTQYTYSVQTRPSEVVNGIVHIDQTQTPPFPGMVVITTDSAVYRTQNIWADAPVWEDISPPWGDHRYLYLDPTNGENAWLVGRDPEAMVSLNNEITNPNPQAVRAAWVTKLAGDQISETIGGPAAGVFLIDGSPLNPNLIYILVGENQDRTWLAHTHDYGVSWLLSDWLLLQNETILDVASELSHGGTLEASDHNGNMVWFTTRYGFNGKVYLSSDMGHSATVISTTPGLWMPIVAWAPADNENDHKAIGDYDDKIWFTTDGGQSWLQAQGITAGYDCDNPGGLLFPSSESDLVYAFARFEDNCNGVCIRCSNQQMAVRPTAGWATYPKAWTCAPQACWQATRT